MIQPERNREMMVISDNINGLRVPTIHNICFQKRENPIEAHPFQFLWGVFYGGWFHDRGVQQGSRCREAIEFYRVTARLKVWTLHFGLKMKDQRRQGALP